MKKNKIIIIWISIILAFAAAIGLIFVIPYSSGNWNTVIKVALVVIFIYITLAVQYASYNFFKFKAKKKVYKKAYYTSEVDDYQKLLKSLKFEERKTNYGYSFLKIIGKSAQKVVIVNDATKYFDQDEEEDKDYKPNKKLENCNIFVALELFFDYDQDVLNKLPEFSIQGTKVYYTAFNYNSEENIYECQYDLAPDEQFAETFNALLKDLEFKRIEK